MLTLAAAAPLGVVVGTSLGPAAGAGTFLAVAVGVGGGVFLLSEGAGRAANRLLHPAAGRSRGYSAAEALAARGMYREAVAAYEAGSREEPHDPVPCLGAARLYARELAEREEALRWFREARSRGLDAGQDRIVIREMVEVAEDAGGGLQVAPDLARYAEAREGTDEERWARTTLARLKEGLREEW